MTDYFDEIFDSVRAHILQQHPEAHVYSDYPQKPGEFPTITIDAENRIPRWGGGSNEIISETMTVTMTVETAGLGKKRLARELIQTAEQWLLSHNFRRTTDYERSELYQSAVHKQMIRYVVEIGKNGQLYRN